MRPTQFRYVVSVRPYVNLVLAVAGLILFSTAEIWAQTSAIGKKGFSELLRRVSWDKRDRG